MQLALLGRLPRNPNWGAGRYLVDRPCHRHVCWCPNPPGCSGALCGECCMAGITIQPHQGIGTVTPSGGSGVNHLTAYSMVGALAWYGWTHIVEKPNMLSPTAHPPGKIRRKATLLLNLSRLPLASRLVREESSNWVMEAVWKYFNIGQISWCPQIDWKASPTMQGPWRKMYICSWWIIPAKKGCV